MGDAQEQEKSSSKMAKMVKAIRAELKISQEDLARDLGVSFATVNRWENDKAAPSRLAKSQLKSFCKSKNIQESLNEIEVGRSEY